MLSMRCRISRFVGKLAAVPAKVDFHDILTSLSLSLSLSVFFFSTSVKNNIIFYKFAVDPKRAKHVQIIKKDTKVLP